MLPQISIHITIHADYAIEYITFLQNIDCVTTFSQGMVSKNSRVGVLRAQTADHIGAVGLLLLHIVFP